jgi:hypothetical protein
MTGRGGGEEPRKELRIFSQLLSRLLSSSLPVFPIFE